MNKVYPTLVVSTMSSGKSTLINAIVGSELLPSMNRACTARAVAILDNDMKSNFEVHAVDNNGVYSHIDKASKKIVVDFNKSKDISEMIIEGEIRGIRNSKKSMLLIDTPGINNSMDMSHEIVTKKVLDEYPEGLILYVINAQQIGTYDDKSFLKVVAKKIRDNPQFSILFAINKMDLIDPAKEKPDELIANCRKYIESNGIENPRIIPVSAESALLFKKVLLGIELSEIEEENFLRNYRYFKREGFSLQDYISVPRRENLEEIITVDGNEYTRAQIFAALENTGLPFLEKQIDETLVRSLKMQAPRITVKKKPKPIKGEQAKVNRRIDKLVQSAREKVKLEEAEYILTLFRRNLENIGEDAQVALDNALNNGVRKSCQDIVEEYAEYIRELDSDGAFNIGSYDMKQTKGFDIFNLDKAEDMLQDEKYITEEEVKVGTKTIKKKGFFSAIARIFGGGYETVNIYEDQQFVNLKQLIQDQVTEVQHSFDKEMNAAINDTVQKVEKLKKSTMIKLKGLDEKIADMITDIDKMLVSQVSKP